MVKKPSHAVLSLKKVITLLRWSMFITGLGILAMFRWGVSKQTDFSSKDKQHPPAPDTLLGEKEGAPEISPQSRNQDWIATKNIFYI